MPYQYVTVDTQLDESKWVQAIEIQPGSPEVVHHVIITLQVPGQGKRSLANQEEDGLWAGYVPGQSVWKYPTGFARALPKGSRLIFQMHYTPNGSATTDLTRVGVIFADEPPEHEVHVKGLSNHRIRIPPARSITRGGVTPATRRCNRPRISAPHAFTRKCLSVRGNDPQVLKKYCSIYRTMTLIGSYFTGMLNQELFIKVIPSRLRHGLITRQRIQPIPTRHRLFIGATDI